MEPMKTKAIHATARRPAILEVTFSDGTCRSVNVEPELRAGVLAELRDFSLFSKVEIDPVGGAEWPNGASLAPEFLRWGPHLPKGCACGYEDPAQH
jgi:hypothetical protein